MRHHVRRLAAAASALVLASCSEGGTDPEPPMGPTIDGVRAPGEWDQALEIEVTRALAGGIEGAIVLVTTDGTDLYLAMEIEDERDANDHFFVRFDNDNDNVLTPGDDAIGVSGTGSFSDGNYDGDVYGPDLATDGEGAAGESDGTLFFEMSHPLDTGDPDDLSVTPGDTVGFCFNYSDAGSSNSGFPSGCILARNEQADYLDLEIPSP